MPNDFHLVHLGARAMGGAGLVYTEMACVSPEGRISLGCTGMYAREHVRGWKRIVDFVHEWTPTAICLQLGHSGRKGSTRCQPRRDRHADGEGNWEVDGPVPARASRPRMQVPRVDDARRHGHRAGPVRRGRRDGDRERASTWSSCTARTGICSRASSRRSPTSARTNTAARSRTACDSRSRSSRAMRAVWPSEQADVRAHLGDGLGGGRRDGDDAVHIAQAFVAAGADIIHVSTGPDVA